MKFLRHIVFTDQHRICRVENNRDFPAFLLTSRCSNNDRIGLLLYGFNSFNNVSD